MENLIKQLIDVATGATGHLNNGMCPDFITGNNSRDEDCPACQVLIEADRIAQQAAGTHHANELRRMARKVGHPAGDVPAVMRAAADRIDELERLVAAFQRAEAGG